MKREIRDKDVEEGRREDRPLRNTRVNDHRGGLTRLVKTGSSPPPQIGSKPPNYVGVYGRVRELF